MLFNVQQAVQYEFDIVAGSTTSEDEDDNEDGIEMDDDEYYE